MATKKATALDDDPSRVLRGRPDDLSTRTAGTGRRTGATDLRGRHHHYPTNDQIDADDTCAHCAGHRHQLLTYRAQHGRDRIAVNLPGPLIAVPQPCWIPHRALDSVGLAAAAGHRPGAHHPDTGCDI